MGNLDELDVIKPLSPNVGGFIQELDARAAQKASAPISTTVNDVLVSIGAGVPKTVAGINDAISMTLNTPYALAHNLFGTSPDPFGAVATFDKNSATLRGIGDQILSEGLSPEAIAQRQAISAPVQDPNANFLDVALAAIKNPLGSATHIAESAPTLGVGAGAGAMGAKLVGSMARPALTATKAITKAEAATKGAAVANALVNAGETFGELKDQPMLDRYSGASIPLGLSLLFGSGADPMVANRVLGEAVTPTSNSLKDVAVNFGKGAAKGGAKEFASEAAEGGSQAVGESVGKREDIDWNKVSKQSTLEGIMGAGQGSVAGGLSNVQMADQQEAKVEDAVAKRVNPVIDALNKLQTELQAQAQQTPVQVEGQPTNSSAEAIKNPAEPIKEPTSTPVEVGAQPINSSAEAIKEPAEAIKEPQQIDVQPIEEQIADPDPEDVLDASSGRVDPTALQNRDRSNPDSVNQMVGIANQPDYARVGYSRDFGNGAPVVAYGAIPENQKGKRDIAIGSSGRRIPVQYAVVEADSVSTSNSAEGARNPDYGKTDRVTAIAGNGRMAGLTLAYRKGTAGNYRQALTADKTHGIDPAVIQGMKNPVLVRIMPNNHVTKDIGDESNTQTTRALSAVEQARTDSRRIDLNDLKFNADGSISNESLSRFVAAMPASERASMVDDQGRPTVQAVDRASNAIFAQAYDDDRITAMYAQATDPDAKLVINALARLAPVMAKLDGCGELDFRPALVDAVNAIVQGKKEKLTIGEIAAQQDFFADPDVTLFIRLFALNSRSVKEAVAILSDAAEFAYAEANKEGQDMFGEVPRATRNDVIDRVQQNYETIQEHKNGKRKAEQAPDVLQDADGGVRSEEDATGRDARADQVAPDARGSESTERSEESVTEQAPEQGRPKFSRNHEGSPSAEDVARTLEADKDIGDAFTQLRGNGEVEVVQSVDDLPEEIRNQIDDATGSRSAKNDEQVSYERGIEKLAQALRERTSAHRAVYNKALSGWIDIDWSKIGEIIDAASYQARNAMGLSHIIDKRSIQANLSPMDVARVLKKMVRTMAYGTYRQHQGRHFLVYKDFKVGLAKKGGNHYVVTAVGSYKTETAPSGKLDAATPLPDTLYARGDFSPGTRDRNVSVIADTIVRKELLFKRTESGDIQGLYDPRTGKVYLIADALTDETAKPVFLHELGVHSAYTKNPLKLETQMKMARNMVNNGVAQGNALAIRVKQRLFDAGEIDSMSDPIPMEAAEECMAYLVEEAASADPRSPFRKWFDKLVAAIKQWLNAHGLNVNLNEWDFVEIAKGNVTAMAREAGRETRLSYSKSGKAPKQSPSKQTPKASKILERDELGRFRLAPGRKLAEKVGQGLSAIDGLLSTAWKFQNAPKELRMQIREMKAKIESAGLTAKEMAEVMQSLSEAERKMISDVVEQELATGVNPPAYVMQIATKISSIMDQQADELVDLGMLSSESRDRFRGKYLPRFYMKSQDKEAQSFFARMFGAKQRLRGVAGGHMKGRGIFKEAPLDAVDQFLQLGWTVRDSKFEVVNGKVTPKQGAFASVPKGNEPVMLWRDYTKQEREQMGEIRDASYRFAVGYMETQRDLAIGRLFKAIASNPDWTSPTPRDGFEHVPVTEISETGGLLKYGALAGKYVDKVVLTHIAHIEEVQDGVKRAYRQAMAFWKEGKTAMNPVSHMNNTVGNFVSAHLAGVDMWDAKTYTKAVKSMMNADALYKEARDAGLFTGSFSQEEFVETMPENLRHLFKSEEGQFKKFGDMFMNVLTWGLRKKMRNAYEMEDALFKMAIYTKCREAGMEPAESVDYAHRYIFVYDVLPEGARKIRDSVLPFFGWTYQAVPMIARSAVSYPWRFFAPAAILFAINTAYYMSAVGDDDDDWIERFKKARELEKAERGLLPDYMKGYTIFMTPKFLRLGVDESTGLPRFLNTSAMVPGGTFLDFENQMGGVPLPEVIMPNHPVINAYAAFVANKDAFSGFDVTKKTDTTAEKVQTFADRAWKLISPSIAVGNYHWNRMMDGIAAETGMTMPFNRTGINRYGEATTLGTAVQNLAGIKVRTVDFDNELDRKLRGYAYEARQIKSEMRSAGRLAQKGALPKDAATEKIEVGKEKIGKIKEKIDESRRSHADIQRLTK